MDAGLPNMSPASDRQWSPAQASFSTAVRAGDTRAARAALLKGAKIDEPLYDKEGCSNGWRVVAIQHACAGGDVPMVDMLVTNHAQLPRLCLRGLSNVAIAARLIRGGISLDAGGWDQCPLRNACVDRRLDIVELLMDHWAPGLWRVIRELNEYRRTGWRPLFVASPVCSLARKIRYCLLNLVGKHALASRPQVRKIARVIVSYLFQPTVRQSPRSWGMP